jgi:hypothetical protein
MRIATRIISILALLLALGLAVLSVYESSSFQECETKDGSNDRAQQQQEGLPNFLVPIVRRAVLITKCIGTFVDINQAAITAGATLAIAIFTGTLWFVTRESIDLARKDFVATHRPRVIVRFIQGPFDDAESRQFIDVTIVNIGVNPAKVETFGGDLARRDFTTLQWEIPGLNASRKPIPPITLISGDRHTFRITAKNPDTFDEKFSDACGNQQLCAVGAIGYTDGNGIARETGFFRIYDNGSKSFVASKNDGEEYQD